MSIIASTKISTEAWNKLTRLYISKFRSWMVSGYLRYIKTTTDKLAFVGVLVDQNDLILYVLNCIGSKYKEIRVSIHVRESHITFGQLYDKLTNYKQLIKKIDIGHNVAIVTTNYTKEIQYSKFFFQEWKLVL